MSCQKCHTAFPVLNSFGEAFRRNGYRFPSIHGSLDSDAAQEATIPLGQEEYEKTFPNSVWPDRISEVTPLSLQVQGTIGYALPGSELRNRQGYNFAWDNIAGPISIFAAGSFSDRISYFLKISSTSNLAKVSAAYFVWNDLVGPSHAFNFALGRLTAPQLTSYGAGCAYFADRLMPTVSVAGLFNPNASFALGGTPVNGVEANGVLLHRVSYSLGWVSSTSQAGLTVPNSEDIYAHVGAKLGGMSLDGEGSRGMTTADAQKPWSEHSVTFDTFGYHGLIVASNNINYPSLTSQRSAVDAVGHNLRLNVGSLGLNVLAEYQLHHRPYPGSRPTSPNGTTITETLPGAVDIAKGRGVVGAAELIYVLYPWLIPGVRAEYTLLDSTWGRAALVRMMPGVSVLIRPNMRLYVLAAIEHATQAPPTSPGNPTTWSAAGGSINPGTHHTEVEHVSASFAWAL